ncbi:MAG: SUMF1/EgtB/PvdO family nonheme iron enzyme, partial [Saprospiraceae bacterium]
SRHCPLLPDGHEIVSDYKNSGKAFELKVSSDRSGIFLQPKDAYRGDVHLKVKIRLDRDKIRNFNDFAGTIEALGVEMVYIPAGAFYIGEPDSTTARRFAAFFKPDANGKHSGVVHINSEKALEVGKDFDYQVETPEYQGDRQGVLADSFPKGFRAFYTMKYELLQGQYATFLNLLSNEQVQHRANFGGRNYYQRRGTIRFDGTRYLAEQPQRPCNFLSWDDAMAYADWAGLRPMTELEFTKAARGPAVPVANGFPWGTNTKDKLACHINEAGDPIWGGNIKEADLNDKNLEVLGASYYWVMDLAGGVWERVITVGDAKGRAFKGTHGDGGIGGYGFANVPDWPKGVNEEGGFGFRGGGFYVYGRPYSEFNPYSPVSYRRFAAWSGGNRSEAYGSRFVRTAE